MAFPYNPLNRVLATERKIKAALIMASKVWRFILQDKLWGNDEKKYEFVCRPMSCGIGINMSLFVSQWFVLHHKTGLLWSNCQTKSTFIPTSTQITCVDPMPARREGRAAKGQPSGTNDPGLKASGQKEGPL